MSKEYFQCPKCARRVDLNKRNIAFGQRCYRCSVLMERVQEEAEPSTLIVEEVVVDEEEKFEETDEALGEGVVAESPAVEPQAQPEEVAPVEATEEVVKEEQPLVEEKVEATVEETSEKDAVSEEESKVGLVSDDDKTMQAEEPAKEPINNLVGEVVEDPEEISKLVEEAVSEEAEVKITEIMEEE